MSQNPTVSPYSAIYAFGDSLSDGGNLSITTSVAGVISGSVTPVSPPYYQEQYGVVSGNVFSNGPTWIQDLSIALGLGTLAPSLVGGNDFAYGGAETGPTPQNAGAAEIQAISLPSQFVQFEAAVPHPSANALFTLSIGSNDVLDILSNATLSVQQQTADVNAAVANEIAFVKQLIADGAKNLLVLDVPDLGKVPDITQGLVNGSDTASAALDGEASQLSAEYDASLIANLTSLAIADMVNVYVVDAYGLIDNAVADPSAYGLTNVTSPVWSGNYTSSSSGTLAATGAAAQNQYLFWDHLHPTETGQQAIAASAAAKFAGGGSGPEITQFYENILQRAPDAGGLAYWEASVNSGAVALARVGVSIANSAEAVTNVVPVVELYTVFGRAPDAGGLHYWVTAFEGGQSLSDIASNFIISAEGQAIWGTAVGTSHDANISFLDTVYQNVLGRAPDVGGENYWAGQIDGAVLTAGQALALIVGSSEAQARDAAPVTNFLIAAGDGTANYGGNLFAIGNAVTLSATTAGGSTFALGTAAPQPITLGAHATADTIVVSTDQDAVYGSGDVAMVSGFTIGPMANTSDTLKFLAGGASAVSATGVTGAFGSGINGTGLSNLTATASAGILTFGGSAANTDTLAQLIDAAANILDTLGAPANQAAAFEYNGSTYLVTTPSATDAGGRFGLATDHVIDLSGVTGVTAIGTTAAPHTVIV